MTQRLAPAVPRFRPGRRIRGRPGVPQGMACYILSDRPFGHLVSRPMSFFRSVNLP